MRSVADRHLQTLDVRRLLSSIIPDADGRPIYTTDAGEIYVLPYVTRAGTLVVEGTSKADKVVVDHQLGTDEASASEYGGDFLVQMLVRHDDLFPSAAPGAHGAVVGKLTVPEWGPVVAADQRAADSAQEHLDFLLSQPLTPPGAIREARDELAEAQQRLAFSQRTLGLIDDGSLTRVRLGEVYDVYVDRSLVTESVRVFANAGADTVTFGHNVAPRTWADGGGGSDRLSSGKQKTILYGGAGNDRLVSRSEQGGQLVGGRGADRYYNRTPDGEEIQVQPDAGGDRLISGDVVQAIDQPGRFGLEPIVPDDPTAGTKPYYILDGEPGIAELLG